MPTNPAPPPLIAAVTGANKGIGLAIVRQLALQYPRKSPPILIYLTARDRTRGLAALKTIQSDPALKRAKALEEDGGLASVRFHALDVADEKSVEEFGGFLGRTHGRGCDVIVNNAGVAMNGFDVNVVKSTLSINYHGTLNACTTLLPTLRLNGRLVNVASMAGHLTKFSPALRTRFRAAQTVADVTALMDEFTDAVAKKEHLAKGWPPSAYVVSKAGMIALTRVLAVENKGRKEQEGVLINACCPGWVQTDMTKGSGAAKTPDQGAELPVLLAIGEIGGVSGEFWENGKVVKW